jgi:translation initiation factor IF-3
VVSITEARKLSSEKNLDLLLLSSNASPPVCKIVNYGQFMYHQKKKEKQSKKTTQVIKELKMSHKISVHDYNVRINQAVKFLSKKFKVKLTIVFRGREIVFRDNLGVEIVKRFINDIEEYGIKDNDIVKSGRNLSVLINPK